MKARACAAVVAAFWLAALPLAAGALGEDSSFKAEGQDYVAEAVGKGATEAEARNDAVGRAVRAMMESLGRDRLFEELFLKNPPVSMSWKVVSSEKGATAWTIRIRLTVDDESLRILYNTAYLSTVSTLLDQAEARLADSERLAASARESETDGDLGSAMSLYWQARDACDAGLGLVEPIGDAAVFSTVGKKKAPELKAVLAAARKTAVAGYDRIRAAEKGLAADEELKSATEALEALEASVAEVEAYASKLGQRAAAIEGASRSELEALSGELGAKIGALKDSRLALKRVEEAVPASKTILRGRIDVAGRRMDGLSKYLAETKADADRERRSPAAVRAKRAQALRWALLHKPTGAFSARVYSPFGLDPAADEPSIVGTGRAEFGLKAEGSLGKSRGLWVRASLDKADYPLSGGAKSVGYVQGFDLGFFGRALWGAGVAWDWIRLLDGEPVDKRLALRAFLGGFDDGLSTWRIAASWELPYELGAFEAANVFNFGLDSSARLGAGAELDLSVSLRPRQGPDGYESCLRYGLGAGFRLPSPFLWGLEFGGQSSRPIGGGEGSADSFFRLYAEYSL